MGKAMLHGGPHEFSIFRAREGAVEVMSIDLIKERLKC